MRYVGLFAGAITQIPDFDLAITRAGEESIELERVLVKAVNTVLVAVQVADEWLGKDTL